MEGYTTTHISPSSCNVLIFLLTLFLFISSTMQQAAASATSTTKTSNAAYVKTSCSSTTYPTVCYQSLSAYASKIKSNPLKLSITALSVTLKAAQNTSSTVSKLLKQKGLTRTEASIIKDCIENIEDSIDEIQKSLKALGHLGGSDVDMQLANIKTWVSAAETDEGTCTDGFSASRVSATVKSKIRKSILSVAKLTSNALCIINRLSYK